MKKLLVFLLPLILTAAGCAPKDALTLKGDIQNNIVSMTSAVSGRIVELNAKQGEPVKKGDIIAAIDNVNQKYTVLQMQAAVDMKKAKLEELNAGARPDELDQTEAQVRAAKAQLDLLIAGSRSEQLEQGEIGVKVAQEAIDSAQSAYDYNEKQYRSALNLFQAGALTQNDLDSIKLKWDTAGDQLSSAKLQLESAKAQLHLLQNGSVSQAVDAARANYDAANAALRLLQSGATKQTIDAAQADLNQSAAQLDLAENNLESCNIRAPEDGIVISRNFEPGDAVNIGSDIADIAVENDLYVLCYIPDRYLDRIRYNQQLIVNTPTGEQTGRLSYIALSHEYTPKDKQSASDKKHTATKIKVAIAGDGGVLKSGMTAEVLIPLK